MHFNDNTQGSRIMRPGRPKAYSILSFQYNDLLGKKNPKSSASHMYLAQPRQTWAPVWDKCVEYTNTECSKFYWMSCKPHAGWNGKCATEHNLPEAHDPQFTDLMRENIHIPFTSRLSHLRGGLHWWRSKEIDLVIDWQICRKELYQAPSKYITKQWLPNLP